MQSPRTRPRARSVNLGKSTAGTLTGDLNDKKRDEARSALQFALARTARTKNAPHIVREYADECPGTDAPCMLYYVPHNLLVQADIDLRALLDAANDEARRVQGPGGRFVVGESAEMQLTPFEAGINMSATTVVPSVMTIRTHVVCIQWIPPVSFFGRDGPLNVSRVWSAMTRTWSSVALVVGALLLLYLVYKLAGLLFAGVVLATVVLYLRYRYISDAVLPAFASPTAVARKMDDVRGELSRLRDAYDTNEGGGHTNVRADTFLFQ